MEYCYNCNDPIEGENKPILDSKGNIYCSIGCRDVAVFCETSKKEIDKITYVPNLHLYYGRKIGGLEGL